MNINGLPTDNLYKFISLFGLVLFLTSLIFPYSKLSPLEIEKAELENEKELLSFDIDVLDKKIEFLKKNNDVEKLLVLRDDLNLLKRKSIEIEGKDRKLKLLISELKFYAQASLWGIVFSSIIIFYGFIRWYYRVQMHEDAILKEKAEKIAYNKKINKDNLLSGQNPPTE